MWSYNLQFMIYKLQLESWCYHHIITYRLIFLNNESYSVANCTCIKEYFEEILLNILCFPLASCTWIVKCFGKMFSSRQFVQCLMFSSKILEIANVGNFQMGLVENYVSCHQNDCRTIGPSLSFSTFPPLSLDFFNLFFFVVITRNLILPLSLSFPNLIQFVLLIFVIYLDDCRAVDALPALDSRRSPLQTSQKCSWKYIFLDIFLKIHFLKQFWYFPENTFF